MHVKVQLSPFLIFFFNPYRSWPSLFSFGFIFSHLDVCIPFRTNILFFLYSLENFSTIFQVSENDWKCFGVIPLSNEAVSCSVFPFYKVAFCGDRKFRVKRPGGKTSSNDKCKQTSSFISWSLSSRPRASSLALRCCVSEEDWTLFISAVSCLLLESSSLSERLSTSAAWRRWVKPRIWLWSALIVRYRKTKKDIRNSSLV